MRIVRELPLGKIDQPVHRIGGSDLCDLWGITPGALTQLVKRGIATRLGHNAYDLTTSTRAYIEHLRGTAAGRGGEEQVLTLTGERARLASAQADAQELKNATLRGEMVKADDVAREWADVLRALRSRLLAVPSRVRQSLGHLAPADVDVIDREIRNTLQQIGQANGED
ncbi:phage terminase Nu1 subunit (DNA packaging protein) [Rhodobacteraceae bacterium MBR-64]